MEPARPNRSSPVSEGKPFLEHAVHETSQTEEPPAAACSSCREHTVLLQAIHDQIASQSTPLQFIWNAVLQIVCVTIGFLFGLYAIFSYHATKIANTTSQQANQLAVLSICSTANDTSTAEICTRILDQAAAALAFLAASNLGDSSITSTNATWPWPLPGPSGPSIYVFWVGAPALAGLLGGVASWRIFRDRTGSARLS